MVGERHNQDFVQGGLLEKPAYDSPNEALACAFEQTAVSDRIAYSRKRDLTGRSLNYGQALGQPTE